jgi:hypothetical protein
VLCAAIAGSFAAGRAPQTYDWSEQRRQSLAPGAVGALRALSSPISLEIYLDRDDSRRVQLERDALAKLRLARPDISIEMPLDAAADPGEAQRGANYGQIVIHVGPSVRNTRSSSEQELVALIFEAAGQRPPDWSRPPYSGYAVVFSGARRTLLGALAYVAIPLGFALMGVALTQRRTAR